MKKPIQFLSGLALFLASCQPFNKVEETAKQEMKSIEVETGVVNVSPEEARKLIGKDRSIIILDVRTPKEFAEGHIAGATNLDFKNDQFSEGVEKLDPEASYLVHCRSGSRSGQALPILEGVPLKKIYHLNSGFIGWETAGMPVEK